MISLAWPLKMASGLKFVLVSICDAANDDGETFLCLDTIAYKTGLSVRAAQRHLRDLEDMGYISKEERLGRSSIYSVNYEILSDAEKHPAWLKREEIRQRKYKTPADLSPLKIEKTSEEQLLTGDKLSPAPADLSPAPADLSPITVTKRFFNDLKPSVESKSRPEGKINFDADTNKFTIPLECYSGWENVFPKLDLDAEIDKAELWLSANPKRRKKNYERFLLGWFTRAAEKVSQPRGFVKHQPGAPAR
jgi:DNA-binding transcriptional ArsR family regulator